MFAHRQYLLKCNNVKKGIKKDMKSRLFGYGCHGNQLTFNYFKKNKDAEYT